MKRLVLFVLLIVIVVMIILFNKGKNKNQQIIDNDGLYVITPTSKMDDANTKSNRDNWKTHSSNLFNYSFSYPPNWHLNTYDEEDTTVVAGSHTLTNYDTSLVERYMDHGIVDWQKFLGEKIAIKIDLSVRNLEGVSGEDYIEKYFDEATLQPKPDLKFGNVDTSQYNTPDAINNILVRQYLAFPENDRVVTASVYVTNQADRVILQNSEEWMELKSIFATFEF